MGGGAPMPSFGLSTGPALSEAQSSSGMVGTGEFNFKQKGGLIQQALPLVALAVVTWLVTRK
ncbi:hypothetical protein KBY28_07755 [Ruegeria pomeroyi]|uniref:hypothetical protein n=1 Tax=Ruegeria pomeroyi TaxID=89184 RepID=UPI001F3AC34D|nr:hypothetical protein [Ruegeria pomeroyi]MCE8508344.1 hypothetical protein [Ruegeria pomeroyi]